MSPDRSGRRCRASGDAADVKGGINAALAITEKKWGTRLDWTCEYVEDWAKSAPAYDIVVTTVEGVESAVGTWRPASDHASGLAASTDDPHLQRSTPSTSE